MTESHPALCRLCTAFCPILVTVQDGRAVKVTGNPDAPLYGGYSCPKGRALPEQHYGASRLLHSVKRNTDGHFENVGNEAAMDEIALKLRNILDRHGPRSVAMYFGMGTVPYHTTVPVAAAFQRAIGSRMTFSAGSIDKPGILIALALHGNWQGGQPPVESADAWLMVGYNPIISKAPGFPAQNPAQFLKDAVQRGFKLVVIDPRRTETARRACLHIQPRPGEDPSILAGIVREIIRGKLYDHAFVTDNAKGLEQLAAAVEPFTPDYVARRAGVPAAQITEAARIFASASHSGVTCGTGPSFATHGTLTEYLALCLATLCGRWSRAGDRVTKPNVLLPAYTAKAQPYPPYKAWGYGEKLRVRGLGSSTSGLSAAALADEILLPGDGQVKALFCVGGNPMMAWPDQQKTQDAMKSLELLVTIDFEMTATARLSHYVIAPKLSLETPGSTQYVETNKYLGTTRGLERPYAAYSPVVVPPPAGASVIEDWEFFYGLAQRMGLKLGMVSSYGSGKHTERDAEIQPMDMCRKPTSEELVEELLRHSRIPLAEVKKHPNGRVYDEIVEHVQPRDADCPHYLDLGNDLMLRELDDVFAASPLPSDGASGNDEYPFRLVARRLNNFLNSFGRQNDRLVAAKSYNPAYMHSDDLKALGLVEGDMVRIRSPHGAILGIVECDDDLRAGVVSMAHGFGDNPEVPEDPRKQGSNTGRLLSVDAEFDPITGIPRMSALPVAIERATAAVG